MLEEAAKGAAAIVAVGSCAAFGGLPNAQPNPTGAVAVSDIVKDKPIINISGCPPIPAVITGVLAHYLTFGELPALDELGRPKAFYGETIHDRCYAARSTIRASSRRPSTTRAHATAGVCTSSAARGRPRTTPARRPSGTAARASHRGRARLHRLLGAEVLDAGSFYTPLSAPAADVATIAKAAVVIGAGAAVAMGALDRAKKRKLQQSREKLTVEDLKGN